MGIIDEQGKPQAVIEEVLPRTSILTRTDSFKGVDQHPIVANAQQMLIVASVKEPTARWGLVDRMLIAAQGGNLRPVICLTNGRGLRTESERALAHYRAMGITTLVTSVPASLGLSELRELLIGKMTVLAGHSGVGKSTLINAIEPTWILRRAQSATTRGRDGTRRRSARRFPLAEGGAVIDTPGVKVFGLWGVARKPAGVFP